MSLSARRAWIEITGRSVEFHLFAVALRKESVDRNPLSQLNLQHSLMSLSARRAWIEIHFMLRIGTFRSSRSPQGERG